MTILTVILIGIGLLILVCVIIKIVTKCDNNDDYYDDDIISQARGIGNKFNDCCVKKIKGMFGGGA